MRIRIALIISICIYAIYAFSQHKYITVEDIWRDYKFVAKRVPDFKPMKDGENYSVNEYGSINEYSYKTGEKQRTYLTVSEIRSQVSKEISIDDYEFSEDESKILISTETKKIYRNSFTAKYYIWDIKTKKLTNLSSRANQRLATFSPKGDKIAYVSENNIYIKDIINGIEEEVTADGQINRIINGATDWVYEEELDLVKGFEWSSDGRMLAYYRFDESHVKEYSFPIYNGLYPEQYKYKYPKAGEANSIVSVYVYDLITKEAKKIDTGEDNDIYIPRIKWTNEGNKLSLQRLNRKQNMLEIILSDVKKGVTSIIYQEENKYYIDITDNLTFLRKKKQFVITSERDGYNHIYVYDMEGNPVKQLTKGNWEVSEIKGIDENDDRIYYISTEVSALDRSLYSIDFNGENKKLLTIGKGTFDVKFSSSYKYYLQTYSEANTPPTYSIYSTGGNKLRTIEENLELKSMLRDYGFVKKDFFSFKTSAGAELNGWLMKPGDFDPDRKYPLLLYVYGGPGSQTVLNRWGGNDYIWYNMLVSKGYIVASVDNRGTGGRGEDFRKCTYLTLGMKETEDQIEAAKYFGSQSYVDSGRIGIWGWSYGGFMAALCLTMGAEYFSTGIAVAPVTNWRYYDNVYTERFMRKPTENAAGYDENSPVRHAAMLKGNLLIIHGTADDNVHFQNAAELIKELIINNKQFDMFCYPDNNHFITGGNTRVHLYRKMTDYLLKNL